MNLNIEFDKNLVASSVTGQMREFEFEIKDVRKVTDENNLPCHLQSEFDLDEDRKYYLLGLVYDSLPVREGDLTIRGMGIDFIHIFKEENHARAVADQIIKRAKENKIFGTLKIKTSDFNIEISSRDVIPVSMGGRFSEPEKDKSTGPLWYQNMHRKWTVDPDKPVSHAFVVGVTLRPENRLENKMP